MVQRRIERRSALLSASDGTMTPRVMDEARMEMRGKGKIIVEGVEGDMRKLYRQSAAVIEELMESVANAA